MKSVTRTIVYNLAVLFVLLIIIELIFGGWIKSSNNLNNLGIIRNVQRQHHLDGLYPDSIGIINYTRDKYGFRGQSTYNAPEKIDILTIGGSTSDQRMLDDSKTWQSVLEENFKTYGKRYLVSNAGVDGQSTFGHIKNFELWFPQVKNLKPKYFIFYIGINDFFTISERPGFDALEVQHKNGYNKFKATIKNNSAIYNLYRKIVGTIKSERLGVFHTKIDFKKFSFTDTAIADKKLFELYKQQNLEGFKSRLLKLIDFCRSYGAKPIFITQPSAKYRFTEGKLLGVAETESINEFKYNGVDFYNLMTELNKTIHEVAGNQFIVVELTSLPIWEEDDFYDWFHMTPKGAKKLGNEIFNQLKSKM